MKIVLYLEVLRMDMKDKKTGVIVTFNREAFVEQGQDFDACIEKMEKEGFEKV